MNIISRTTRVVSSLFSKITVARNAEVHKIHSLCSEATFQFGRNEQQSILYSGSFLQAKLPILDQFYGMKYKTILRLRCKGCYYVSRKERMYVMCKLKPRHKQSTIPKREKNTWICTHATQGKIREW